MLAQHGLKLTGMAEGELPQQRPQGGRRVHPVEQCGHPTGAQRVQIVDAVRTNAHPGDHAQQLGYRVRRARADPRGLNRHLLGEDLRQSRLLGQPEHRHQPRTGHQIVFIEARGAGGELVGHSH